MTDLNNLIPSGTLWTLFSADHINDRGEIVGTGNWGYLGTRTYLLTPMTDFP
jgi:hypothetical protein